MSKRYILFSFLLVKSNDNPVTEEDTPRRGELAGYHNIIEVVPVDYMIRQTLRTRHCEEKMVFLHRAMSILMEPLISKGREGFITKRPIYD